MAVAANMIFSAASQQSASIKGRCGHDNQSACIVENIEVRIKKRMRDFFTRHTNPRELFDKKWLRGIRYPLQKFSILNHDKRPWFLMQRGGCPDPCLKQGTDCLLTEILITVGPCRSAVVNQL